MRTGIFILLTVIASAAGSQETPQTLESDLELLGALHQIRAMWLDPDIPDWRIERLIDDSIDTWRGPLPDGSYRWVLRARPESEIVDRSEHLVYGTMERPALIEDGEAWVYGVRIVVPRKRSLFRGNHAVWVDSLTIRLRGESGVPIEEEVPVERWFSPNTSQSWDFEMIVPRAEVAAEVAAEPEHRGESLIEIHFLESIERDDPRGPNYGSIQVLLELEGQLSAERIDLEIERVERRLIPASRSVAVATVAELLEDALTLMESEDPEERTRAAVVLQEAIALIRGE